jgi:hypothetical protein
MVLKRNVSAFSLRTGEFSPNLESGPIFPTRFNALIWNLATPTPTICASRARLPLLYPGGGTELALGL